MKKVKLQDNFEVLRKIHKNPDASQRKMAEELGFSLGKLNYCLKSLKSKGLVKINNFSKQKNKINYIQYILTAKGISERTKLTINFMKRKMKEYDDLKKELEQMWAIIKVDKKKISFFKSEIKNKLGEESIIYSPKLLIKKITKNKLREKEHEILGDYLFCYNKNFSKINFLKQLNFIKGVKYFLNGFQVCQGEIEKFIDRCKNLEDKSGYISQGLYQEEINKYYKFSSGLFADKIFKIIQLQKNKIDILIGNLKTTVNKEEFLFRPVQLQMRNSISKSLPFTKCGALPKL